MWFDKEQNNKHVQYVGFQSSASWYVRHIFIRLVMIVIFDSIGLDRNSFAYFSTFMASSFFLICSIFYIWQLCFKVALCHEIAICQITKIRAEGKVSEGKRSKFCFRIPLVVFLTHTKYETNKVPENFYGYTRNMKGNTIM